jgi:Leucine-rich repeat (LRR) protein
VIHNPRHDETLAQWKQNRPRLLMFLVDSESRQQESEKYRQQKLAIYPGVYWTRACVELDGQGPAKLLMMDFEPLTDPKQILQHTRDAVAAVARKAPAGAHTIRWPGGVPEGLVFSGSGLFLTVPVDSRVEAQARRWVRIEAGDSLAEDAAPELKRFVGSTVYGPKTLQWAAGRFREEGVKALGHFRSDANVAILRRLAEDPADVVRTVERGGGAAVQQREYPVRQAAKEVLEQWAMPAEGIVTHEQLLRKEADPAEREAIAWIESLECDVCYHPMERPDKYRTVQLVHLGRASLGPNTRQAADLTLLATLKNLENLTATSLPIRDLTPLAGLKSLRSLTLWSTKLTDLTPVAGLENLRSLSVGGALRDISPLANLTNLQTLDLGHTRVADLTPLAQVKALRYLDLAGTPVVDLRPLAGLTNLEDLNLSATKVTDLTPLANLKKLEQLNLEGTPVSDLAGLEGLDSLEILDASETQIRDLTPLLQLSHLKWLDLNGTKVDDVAPLRRIESLQSVFLSDTAVSEQEVRELRAWLQRQDVDP